MLDLFFRKYAWTANLVLLLAAAWLVARIVNTLVGVAIRPPPRVEAASSAASTAPRSAQPVSLDVERLYHLIGQQPPAVAAEAAGPAPTPQNCDDPNAAPARSNSRIVLLAAVIAERPSASLVTLTDSSSHTTAVVGVGDEFAGARMLGLQRVRDEADTTGNGYRTICVICNGGTKEYVEFSAAPIMASAVENPNLGVAPVPAPRGGGGEGVRVVSANKYEIEKGVIDRTLSNMNTIATQARIVPSFKNGVANGFKLFSIQPGSLYSSIGIENGDVIQRINGYEINSPEKALELYQKLRDSQQVSIEVERGGQVIRKEYSITP